MACLGKLKSYKLPHMNIDAIKTPCYVCEEKLLEDNLKILQYVQKQSGAKIILALKGFAMWSTFDIVAKYIQGCTASGLYETKLAYEEFKTKDREIHTYSPAFKDDEIEQIALLCDHIVFNSIAQLKRFKDKALHVNKNISISLRINPETSFAPIELYNPCAPYSRLGVTLTNFDKRVLPYLDGLNFHALCEQNVDALEDVLCVFEKKFGSYIDNLKYINFGGGHHITKKDYEIEKLISVIKNFKAKHHDIDIYLEPGEAIGWQSGFLVTTVLDIVNNGIDIAILDTSAEAHMPDILAMPYKADVRGANDKYKYKYRLSGNTCLAGDIMGDYTFQKPLHVGDKIIFEDQIHYTFVKNTTFNGIKLPSLAILRKDKKLDIIKEFGYYEYKNRLS